MSVPCKDDTINTYQSMTTFYTIKFLRTLLKVVEKGLFLTRARNTLIIVLKHKSSISRTRYKNNYIV